MPQLDQFPHWWKADIELADPVCSSSLTNLSLLKEKGTFMNKNPSWAPWSWGGLVSKWMETDATTLMLEANRKQFPIMPTPGDFVSFLSITSHEGGRCLNPLGGLQRSHNYVNSAEDRWVSREGWRQCSFWRSELEKVTLITVLYQSHQPNWSLKLWKLDSQRELIDWVGTSTGTHHNSTLVNVPLKYPRS